MLAKIFKWIFQIKFTRRYYFGLYKRLFNPKKLFKGQVAVCRYDGNLKMKVDLDEWIQQNIYFFGVYDPLNINFIKKHLKPGDYFFDIGANVGCFSLVASLCVQENGKVYAFEPVKEVYNRLNENIELNRLNNILTINKAVYEKNTLLKLYLASQENLGMTSIKEHDAMSGNTLEVEAVSLDSFVISNEINRVDFIKIDIEGSELNALKGMVNIIRKHQPVFLVEVSEAVLNDETDRNEVFNFFDAFDYDKFVISDEGTLKTPVKDELNEYTNYIFQPR